MGLNKSPTHLRGFMLSLDLSKDDIWTAQANYSTAEKKAGAAIPANKEKLVINTTGSQINNLDLRTQAAGTPGKNKASFIWKKETEMDWYGDNSFNAITDFQFLKMKSTLPLNTYGDPSCLALQNGDLLFSYTSTEAVGKNGIIVKRMEADGSVFSSGTTVFNTLDYTGKLTGSNPAMCQLSDGSVLLVIWANYVISTNLSNLWVYRSTNNGQSWSLVSTGALDASIDRSVYALGRISIDYYNGQVLLIASIKKTGATRPDIILQAASIDEGMSFSTIGTTDNNYYCFHPSLVVCDDGFLLTYITNLDDAASNVGKGECFLFPNAFFPFANRGNIVNAIGTLTVGTISTVSPHEFTTGASTSWKDRENNIFVIFRNLPSVANGFGGNGGWWMMVSNNNGSTWNYAGGKNANYIPPYIQTMNDDNEYLRNLSACSTKGKSWIFCQPETTAGTLDNSLMLICLRGYTSISLPPRFQDATIYEQFGYNHSYIPFITPDILPNWTGIIGGSPTISLTTDGLKIETTTTSNQQYKYNYISPDANHTETGSIVRFVVRAAVGGSSLSNDIAAVLSISDASHNYKIICRLSNIAILIIDDLAGSTLSTTTPGSSTILTDTGVEILIALADGKVSAFYRPNDHVDAKGWFPMIENVMVSDGGGTGSNYFNIGNLVSPSVGTVTSYWGEVCISYKKGYGGQYYPNLAKGFGNPNDLMGNYIPPMETISKFLRGCFCPLRMDLLKSLIAFRLSQPPPME